MKIIGLKIIKQKVIKNKKGDILKFISKKESFFKKFGEIYFTEIKKNKTKGWNYHKKNKCFFLVPYGKVKFHLVDGRKKSKSFNHQNKIILQKKNLRILSVPAGIWFSFKSLAKHSIVANCLENPHSDKETLKSKKIKNIVIFD